MIADVHAASGPSGPLLVCIRDKGKRRCERVLLGGLPKLVFRGLLYIVLEIGERFSPLNKKNKPRTPFVTALIVWTFLSEYGTLRIRVPERGKSHSLSNGRMKRVRKREYQACSHYEYASGIQTIPRRSTMAHVITDECVACGACLPECPEDAIQEGDPIYTIDAAKCTDCGTCVEACPSEAIKPA